MTPYSILQSDPREDRCRRLHAQYPDCECELESGAINSPGPIAGHETLARIIYAPQFWDEVNGKLKTAAFDEVSNCGLSVTRLSYCSEDELNQQISERISAKPGRYFIKILGAKFNDIKSIVCEGRRAFCGYDSPTSTNVAHANICQAHPPSRGSLRAEMRRNLQKLFVDVGNYHNK